MQFNSEISWLTDVVQIDDPDHERTTFRVERRLPEMRSSKELRSSPASLFNTLARLADARHALELARAMVCDRVVRARPVPRIARILGAIVSVFAGLQLAHGNADPRLTDAGTGDKVTLRPVVDWRVQASAGHRIASVHRARIIILAVDALAKPDANAFGTLAGKALDVTDHSIDLVRVGARGIHRVAHIVGAVIAVAAIDIAA
jgi:hypothetical protein